MTKFEEVSSIINRVEKASDMRENCIYWLDGDKFATVNVSARSRYATRIRKLAEEHPDEAKVFSDEEGGYLVASIPVKAVKLNIVHGNGREMTDEQKQAAIEALARYRESKKAMKDK